MSSARAADTDALVVPIDVVGLCVGTIDAQEATNGFAGPTAVFVQQTTERYPAFLGGNVTRSFDDAPGASQLTQGVHLHWALPDALTRADTSGGGLGFPACPTRWLVTRLTIDGASATGRSWLLESDAVSADQQTSLPVTVPVKASVIGQGFGYLGRVTAPGEDGFEAAATSLSEATEAELTAVTNGEVGFAAYYPSCGSAFGFHDQLDDLAPPADDPAQLAYVVVGWFGDATKDPVKPGATPAALEKAQRWTFSPATPAPSSSVYSGLVQGIAWSPDKVYVDQQPAPLEVEGAIGGTPAEALSAYFNHKDKPPLKLFEQLLDAFQLGQLDRFKEPQPNQLTKLEETVHDSAFAGMHAGDVYTLVVTSKAGKTTELVDLPPQLADALNLLNLLEQQKDLCLLHTRWYRWQLFADWYRIFEAGTEEKRNDAATAAEIRYGHWSALDDAYGKLVTKARAQLAVVEGQLAPHVCLRRVPATPYSQPADPAVLLTGEGVDFPERYGGDGRFDANGNLVCRPGDNLLTGVTVGGHKIEASSFTGAVAPEGIPNPALVAALIREACLLSTAIGAAVSGQPAATLEAALQLALAGGEQTEYAFTGEPPSPVGVNWWTLGQWLPVFASWSVDYLPLLAVDRKTGSDTYPVRFVNANYRLDQNAGGALAYAPDGGPGSIEVDPSTAEFTQSYSGGGHLTPTPPQLLASLLKGYLASHTDASLEEILGQLEAAGFLVTPLAGLSDLMTMRRQELQLEVKVPEDSEYADLTDAVRPIVGSMNRIGPDPNGSYNPIRAGYLKLSLTLVDVFGQKRAASFTSLACSDAMTTLVDGRPLASVAYMQPRISQPSRLLFRWLAADSTGYEEATAHPAASPVCGWIVPNHLDGSLFLYNAQGAALGTLFLEHGGTTPIGWQSAPGSDATIDEDVATAMRHENPQLRDFAVSLKGASTDTFTALWKVVDTVGDTVEPGHLATNTGLAALLGRPVALTQAALRLEVNGHPDLNIWWDYLGEDTDNGFSGVEFPVVLGDLAKLEDGLIGYYKQAAPDGPYDFGHFYSQGADESGEGGVVRPTQDTLCVTPTPLVDTPEPPELGPYTRKLLMLVDPRAQVHATSGILPTATLTLPPDQTQPSLASLDFSFFTAPVLKGASALTLPTPVESGYQLSWVEQSKASGTLAWDVTPEIDSPSGQAVWAYTPQSLSDGWLRLNPILLDFDLADSDGKPVVTAGGPNALTLTIANKATRAIALRPGSPVAEGTVPAGSIFYVHFGALVAQSDVPLIALSASGWSFQLFTSAQYGAYWAATPQGGVVLEAGASLVVDVTNLTPASTASQAQVYFDYYEIDGMSDGVYVDVVAVRKAPTTR